MNFKHYFYLHVNRLRDIALNCSDMDLNEAMSLGTNTWSRFNTFIHENIHHLDMRKFHDTIYTECLNCKGEEEGVVIINWGPETSEWLKLHRKDEPLFYLYKAHDLINRYIHYFKALKIRLREPHNFTTPNPYNPCAICKRHASTCMIYKNTHSYCLYDPVP